MAEYASLKQLYEKLISCSKDIDETDDENELQVQRKLLLQYISKCTQLEKQVHLLTDMSEIRRDLMYEVDNFISELSGTTAQELQDPNYLQKWCKAMKNKIVQYQMQEKEAKTQPYFFAKSAFLNSPTEKITVQEFCKGGKNQDLPYLNVEGVTMVEDKLNRFYEHLLKLNVQLQQKSVSKVLFLCLFLSSM